jgi:hypothetical protein
MLYPGASVYPSATLYPSGGSEIPPTSGHGRIKVRLRKFTFNRRLSTINRNMSGGMNKV